MHFRLGDEIGYELVTPIKVDLLRNENLTDKLHQSAPELHQKVKRKGDSNSSVR